MKIFKKYKNNKTIFYLKVSQLIGKHQEQKEAFLKACTLARRTAETFLKYAARSTRACSRTPTAAPPPYDARVRSILDALLAQENNVCYLNFVKYVYMIFYNF